MQQNSQTLDFEAALAELEKVVAELDGELKLENALALFDRGMKLSSDCQKFLEAAEQKVEVLRRNAQGELETQPFGGSETAD